MKIRKVTSLSALLAFIFLMLTGIVLYIVPNGRIAYWSDWHLLGLSKSEWGDIHINLALLFILTIFLHTYYNWKQILSYLEDKAKHLKIFTRELNVALILLFGFVAGTYFEIPPFHWVIDLNASIKDSAAKTYGEPPYGHAELSSLETFTTRMSLDYANSVKNLKKVGIRIDGETQTLQGIAKQNRLSPQQIYLAMEPAVELGRKEHFPHRSIRGFGKQTLAELCQEYYLDSAMVLKTLRKNRIEASVDMTIRQIAEQNDRRPIEIYELLKY